MGAQCHAFAHARYQEGVRNCQERKVLTETEVFGVKEDNRLVCKCREARVYTCHDVCHPAMCLIFFRCLKGNLDEDDLVMVLWVLFKKCFECE
jgi:hypothetical protein